MAHPLSILKNLGLVPRGLIHVGSNRGQEFEDYRNAGLHQILYIEPIRHIYDELKRKVERAPGHFAINALCTDRDGQSVNFHISSNDGQSSSILDFGWHSEQHPEVRWVSTTTLTTTTLDTLISRFCRDHPSYSAQNFDCLVLDTQGSELSVFRGSLRALATAAFVFTEVNEGGLYRGDCSVDDIIAFLKNYGFRIKNLQINRHRWGDALFVKEPLGTPNGPRVSMPLATS